MKNRIILTVHIAAAKSWEQYLADNGNDVEAAGKAARNDVAQREGQNAAARAFHRAYKPVVEKLNLPADVSDESEATEAGIRAIDALTNSGETNAKLSKAVEQLGIDPSNPDAGVNTVLEKIENGTKLAAVQRELAFTRAADALGWDGAKLTKILRDEQGLPELRKMTVGDKEEQVWGISRLDAKGKETAFVALAEHPEVKAFEVALKKATTDARTAAQVAPQLQMPQFVPQRAAAPVTLNGKIVINPSDLTGGVGTI